MNIKSKFVPIFLFLLIFTLSIINIKNSERTKFYLFTSKTEEISLGNLITAAFITGFTYSSLLALISNNNIQESVGDNLINDEEIDKSDENTFIQELETERPPERDLRESHPTISVNYRFVDQDNNSYNSKKKKNDYKNEDNDWINNDNEW